MEAQNKILVENEMQANRVVAKVMRVSFLVFTVIYILECVGVFAVDFTVMTVSYIAAGVLLLLPTLLVNVLKQEYRYIKYLNVAIATLFTTALCITMNYHMVLAYVYPIAIASLYFSQGLSCIATALTVAGVSIAQIVAFVWNILPDRNFQELHRVLFYGLLPRTLILIGIAAVFIMLSARTHRLLSRLLRKEAELSNYHKEMIMGFAVLVENKDGSTGGHIKRTTAYVKLLAEELRDRGLYADVLTEEYIQNLCMAAPMHDIGKIAVPDVILQKPGRLTDAEYECIRQHTKKGGQIVEETFGHLGNEQYTWMAFQVARYHHEKWNGQGYPEGLREREIPLCARIMAIADVFDALAEDRCYREALPMDKCFEIIERGRGEDFDPLLTGVFLDIREKVTYAYNSINKKMNTGGM